jgi:hypothetical protein
MQRLYRRAVQGDKNAGTSLECAWNSCSESAMSHGASALILGGASAVILPTHADAPSA